jgi:hypothetical protein
VDDEVAADHLQTAVRAAEADVGAAVGVPDDVPHGRTLTSAEHLAGGVAPGMVDCCRPGVGRGRWSG